jgi:glycine/D-amino acid oxidase-like deaminating enzyme
MANDRALPKSGSPNGSTRELTAVLPAVSNLNVTRIWDSLEACSIDSLPAVGEIDGLDGLLMATGFTGHGFALAPSVGVLLSEFILTGKTSLALDELNARRFANCDAEQVNQFLRGDEHAKASMGGLN